MGFPADKSFEARTRTPAHPDYPMGHSVTGEAIARVLIGLSGKDDHNISLTSYKLPGATRSFTKLSDIPVEDSNSRVLGGIHFGYGSWFFSLSLFFPPMQCVQM